MASFAFMCFFEANCCSCAVNQALACNGLEIMGFSDSPSRDESTSMGALNLGRHLNLALTRRSTRDKDLDRAFSKFGRIEVSVLSSRRSRGSTESCPE